jgi:hypothetical protein
VQARRQDDISALADIANAVIARSISADFVRCDLCFEHKKTLQCMEGRRIPRLVASAWRPHPAFAIHLAQGQVGKGVGPCLDVVWIVTNIEQCDYIAPNLSLMVKSVTAFTIDIEFALTDRWLGSFDDFNF